MLNDNHIIMNNTKIKYLVSAIFGLVAVASITLVLNKCFGFLFIGSLAISLFATIDICYVTIYYWNNILKLCSGLKNIARYFFKKYKEFIRFGMVGAIGAGINYTILYLLTDKLGVYYLVSAIIGAFTTTIFNYTVNHYWTFHKTKIRNNWFIGWLRYKFIDDISVLVYLGQLTLYTEVFNLWYLYSAILATVINYPIRYMILKMYIWEKKEHFQSSASYEWDAFYNGNPIQMWWKRQIAETVWNWLPNTSNVLDIGCGSSPINTRYANLTAIDTNDEKLQFMKQKNPKGNYCNAKTNDFTNESFEHVTCIEVIEHLENPIEMISEISRLLKNNGTAIIATPDYSKKLWGIVEFFTPYKEEHYNKFTSVKLDGICQKYDLYPVKYKYVAGCDLVVMFIKSKGK